MNQRSQFKTTAKDIELIFDSQFRKQYQTILRGGFDEPFYKASDLSQVDHCIGYRSDFLASALHEVAHWCVAGESRRLKDDYGYWYIPDGRTREEQLLFFQAEALPQALEKYFHKCIGSHLFHLSIDNLHGLVSRQEELEFAAQVEIHYQKCIRGDLPIRGKVFSQALKGWFCQGPRLSKVLTICRKSRHGSRL